MYEQSNGSVNGFFDMRELGEDLNIEYEEMRGIVDYLKGENLIQSVALGGVIALTHQGIKEVEQALENPNTPSKYFPPINIINIGSMNNSTLQQATNNSSIVMHLDSAQKESLDAILSKLNDIQDLLGLSADLQLELGSEINTLLIQKESPKPKGIIMRESLKSIRTILESVTANVLTPKVIESISLFLDQN